MVRIFTDSKCWDNQTFFEANGRVVEEDATTVLDRTEDERAKVRRTLEDDNILELENEVSALQNYFISRLLTCYLKNKK